MGVNYGFVKVPRNIIDWEWYSDIPVRTLFLHLLFTVNFKDVSWRGIKIRRAQRVISLHNLATETGLSVQQVRTALNKLKSTSEITTSKSGKFTVVTINASGRNKKITWFATEEQQQNNSKSTSKTTTEQQFINNGRRKIKKDKEYIEEREYARAREGALSNDKRSFGKYNNVFLTDEEFQTFQSEHKDYNAKIDRLSQYIQENGKHYEDHFAVLCRWADEDAKKLNDEHSDRTYDATVFDEFDFTTEIGGINSDE